MSKKGIALLLIVFLVCIGTSAEEESPIREVSERLIARINRSSLVLESLTVSQDSKRVAYVAKSGNKCFVVVDEKEGKQYDVIITRGGIIIFDSPDNLHYLVLKDSDIYLVEERLE